MLSKETFVEAINRLRELSNAEQALYDATNGSMQLLEWKPYSDVIDMYVRMLEEAMNVEVDDMYGSNISYFIYDLEYGTKWTETSITDANGTPIDISTVEKLYDFLIAERAEQ